MTERFDESTPLERAPTLENDVRSAIASEVLTYYASDRPAPPSAVPAEFPTFVRDLDGSFTFMAPGSMDDSLIGVTNDQAQVRMNDAGDLQGLTVKLGDDVDIYFAAEELMDRNGRFRDGEHGTRTFDAHGTMTYTSPDGKFKIVIDRCGKVISMTHPKGDYSPSPRRLGMSACNS